ncbi:hypothetical protein ACOMHN_054778 [Nucella lapillus]
MQRFQTSCSDNSFLSHACDLYFIFCIDKQRIPNINQCFYKKSRSGSFSNENNFNFGSDIQGVANPLVADVRSFPVDIKLRDG